MLQTPPGPGQSKYHHHSLKKRGFVQNQNIRVPVTDGGPIPSAPIYLRIFWPPRSSRSSRWYYREIILNRIALRSYVDRRTTRILLNWERMMQCMHNLRSQGLRESGCTRNETRSDQVDLVVGNGGLAVPASFLFAWILFCKARPRYRRGRLSLSIPPLTDPRGIQVGLGQCGSDTW